MTTLGIDLGSSSVKVSLMDVESGKCLMSVGLPEKEMPIHAPKPGWAEQDPEMWWRYVCEGIRKIGVSYPLKEVGAIGIAYQMHGLVTVDASGKPLREAIIWCDSRAVEIGEEAFNAVGGGRCLAHALNSPGNFTASKLAWVKRNEPEVFAKVHKFMLPGDYIAYKLSGEMTTTEGGLSEGILWDFKDNRRADFIADYFGLPDSVFCPTRPALGVQCVTSAETQTDLGVKAGTPISYRAGDQPNNAFSLNVLDPGGIAATAGTSGVVYGVTDVPEPDPKSRVNTFLHVNHTASNHRYGVLLCINGTGIMNAWTRRLACDGMNYDRINDLCAPVPAGCDGLTVLPFGNGAERMLENRCTGSAIMDIDLNRHTNAHVLRAVQEGIAFAFRYGIDIMKQIGVSPSVIRAGKANMFLSPVFRNTLASLCNAKIELYNTDGSLGSARGAALGAGFYRDAAEAFVSLTMQESVSPCAEVRPALEDAYSRWKCNLETVLNRKKV